MIPAAEREAQATACLEAAEKYQPALLALAAGLSGSKEAGMELFQQAVLNCHDAIQVGGFQGDHYHFYLRRAIKNLHYRTQKEALRWSHITFMDPQVEEEALNEWDDSYRSRRMQPVLQVASPLDTQQNAVNALAEQVMSEAQQKFSFADRIALRLSLDGLSCQQIAEHIGMKDQSWVNRRLKRMKEYLRGVFQPAFDNLGE